MWKSGKGAIAMTLMSCGYARLWYLYPAAVTGEMIEF